MRTGDMEEDHGYRKSCRVKTKLERYLIVLLVLAICIGIGLTIALISYSKGNSKLENLCLTPQCMSTAGNLLRSMDLTQDPCEDFYNFTCGNWIKNSNIEDNTVSPFTPLYNIIKLRVKEWLSSPNPKLSQREQKVQRFYNTCMDMDSRNEMGLKVLKKDLASFGGWPLLNDNWRPSKFNWTNLLIRFFESGYPFGMFFHVEVNYDVKNTSRNLVYIAPPSLGLPSRDLYFAEDGKSLLRYQQLIWELASHLDPKKDRDEIVSAVNETVNIEKRFAEITDKNLGVNPDQFYNIFTLKELEKLTPKIPWRYILSKFLPYTFLKDDEGLMVMDPPALQMVQTILEEVDSGSGVSKRDLANYMFTQAVLFAANHLDQDLYSLTQDKLHFSSRGPLWKTCVTDTIEAFQYSLTATYTKMYLDTKSKSDLETMLQGIRVSVIDAIKQADWLDQETKEKALLKVQKIISGIAHREEMLDELNEYYDKMLVGDYYFTNVKNMYIFFGNKRMEGLRTKQSRFRWQVFVRSLEVNAFYVPPQNSILVPIGILQEFVFSPKRPNYINYGRVGTILGHEYTHAFDNRGALFDDEGNYKTWWTDQSWKNFEEKTKCFVNQYDKYYESPVESFVNGTTTVGENIADYGGGVAAYKAYKRLLSRIGSEEKLPGLPFTDSQMFWIAYGSLWCEKNSDESILNTLKSDVHSPARFRVIGSLSNIKEFSDDFNCKVGSNLNPATKCTLWKG